VGRLECDEIRGVDSGAVIEKLGERGTGEDRKPGEGWGAAAVRHHAAVPGDPRPKDWTSFAAEELSVSLRPPAPPNPMTLMRLQRALARAGDLPPQWPRT